MTVGAALPDDDAGSDDKEEERLCSHTNTHTRTGSHHRVPVFLLLTTRRVLSSLVRCARYRWCCLWCRIPIRYVALCVLAFRSVVSLLYFFVVSLGSKWRALDFVEIFSSA